MNVIALMPPLSLIKRLKMYVQATFVFFCAKLYMYFMIGNLFVVLYLLYFLNIHFKKLINIHF